MVTSPTNTSPRESSDGYDVVSSTSANIEAQQKSKDVIEAKEVKPVAEKKAEDNRLDAAACRSIAEKDRQARLLTEKDLRDVQDVQREAARIYIEKFGVPT